MGKIKEGIPFLAHALKLGDVGSDDEHPGLEGLEPIDWELSDQRGLISGNLLDTAEFGFAFNDGPNKGLSAYLCFLVRRL